MSQTRPGVGSTDGVTPRELIERARQVEGSDPDQARALLQDARVLARSRHDVAYESEAVYGLARNSYRLGNSVDAFSVALEAVAIARRSDAPSVEVHALSLLATIQHDAGNFGDALSNSLAALERARSLDDPNEEPLLLNNLAAIHHSLRDLDRAIVTYESALSANRGIGNPMLDAVTLANMSRLRAERSEYLLAIGLGESALVMLEEHHPTQVAQQCAHLASMYLDVDDRKRAGDYLRKARATCDDDDPDAQIEIAFAESKMFEQVGNLDQAIEPLRRALHVASEANLTPFVLQCHERLYRLHKSLGEFELALDHHEQRHAIHEDMFNRGQDLRIKTLQIAHDTEAARSQAEILRLRTTELEDLVRGRTEDLEEFQLTAFQRLSALAEFRDLDAGEHSTRVGDLAAAIADELREPADYVSRIRMAARLHDIGKLGVPDHILLKSSPLTDEEFVAMKQHTTIGARLLGASTSPTLQLASEAAQHHHEWWDGSGYPTGLAGTAIPLAGRIVAVADVFDALVTERPFKAAWEPAEAFAYIWAASGTHFEPRIVDAFTRVLARDYPEAFDRPVE